MSLPIGLTGGIATGKSTVSAYLKSKSVTVIDADEIAKKVVEPGKAAHRKIMDAFGSDYFDTEGFLDRDKMSDRIFSDADARKKLNSITHPYVAMEMVKQYILALLTFQKFVVFDIPLLFESGANKAMWKTVVVHCDEGRELGRLIDRDGVSEEVAKRRIQAQMPLSNKVKLADFALENNQGLAELYAQLDNLLSKDFESSTFILVGRMLLGAFGLGVAYVAKLILF